MLPAMEACLSLAKPFPAAKGNIFE